VAFAVFLHLVMTTTEMVVMKYIYITKFSMIAAINENFISTILILFNIVVIVINMVIHMVTKDMEIAPKYFQHNASKSTIGYKLDISGM
jgi:hypothetical protein